MANTRTATSVTGATAEPDIAAETFVAELLAEFGADAVLPGDAIGPDRLTDWSGQAPVRPLALLRPRSVDEVAAMLRACHRHRRPVVPQGGRTGLAGGAVPAAAGVALSLDRLATIESIDAASATATVQAGVTLQSLRDAAQAAGLQFGVDLGSRGSCQIGGNLSTNAGGNGVLQYGMMREQTLGLEVVLADGSLLSMLRPMLKNNTGYDLKQFFIGAEGTLGVITRAVLRLQPQPRARATALLAFADYPAAVATLRAMQRRFGGAVAAFELMWADFYRQSLAWSGLAAPLAQTPALSALIDVVGDDAARLDEALQQALQQALDDGLLTDAVLAASGQQAATLWRLREAPAEFPTRLRPVNFDVSLPIAAIGPFADDCRRALGQRWPGYYALFFGHIGDGNLHITVDMRSLGTATAEHDAAGWSALEHDVEALVYGELAPRHGSISAEHGIGVIKKPFLGVSRTPAELATMRAIKLALDPFNLMNPGKILDLEAVAATA